MGKRLNYLKKAFSFKKKAGGFRGYEFTEDDRSSATEARKDKLEVKKLENELDRERLNTEIELEKADRDARLAEFYGPEEQDSNPWTQFLKAMPSLIEQIGQLANVDKPVGTNITVEGSPVPSIPPTASIIIPDGVIETLPKELVVQMKGMPKESFVALMDALHVKANEEKA